MIREYIDDSQFGMSNNVVQYVPEPAQSAKVVRLSRNTETKIDVDDFVALLQSKGSIGAEDVVFSALEEMAARIERIRLLWQDGDLTQIPKICRCLAKIAKGAGLLSVEAASSAVCGALKSQDPVALSATIERLDRSFDATVAEIWQVLDEI